MSKGKYPEAKVYFDGSHYIAIPNKKQPWKKRKKVNNNLEHIPKEIFEKAYKENENKKKCEKKEIIEKELETYFNDKEKAKEFTEINFNRKKRNLIERRKRLVRKVNLQEWNYFCTFTYDSNKLNEIEFRKRFSNCLKKLSYRKNWKYIGVWERSPENNRLHFHGLFYTPIMIGEFIEKRDYSTKKHQMQNTLQNTYFLERFGRNDFKPIVSKDHIFEATRYIMKYLEKSGEKIIYSKELYQYFLSDIIEDDIVCKIGQEDRKLLLFDNFHCLYKGEVIGQVCQEVINKMPKSN